MHRGTIRIHYPISGGEIVLRSEQSWDDDLHAARVSADRTRWEFDVAHERPHLEYKPCLREAGELLWSVGPNKLALLSEDAATDCYPHFRSGWSGLVTPILEIPSAILGRRHRLRVYLPAGYEENRLKRYPVLYLQDGRNLFFPEEAFLGREWRVDENLDRLDAMNLVDQTIAVGVWAGDRGADYTGIGYERFGRSLVEEVKPAIDERFRTLPDPARTGVMGSSLGGVVSFFLAWQWPGVFGNAACMSSTFGWQDDLIERVRREPRASRENLRIYLDSGWPNDNYEPTLAMAVALLERGFRLGRDLLHFAFPLAGHDEGAWSARLHLPLQLFSGKLRAVDRASSASESSARALHA
jgi:enterochelin esterase-like enzyme